MPSAIQKLAAKLPFGLRYEIFYQAARSIGVSAYLVEGFQGSYVGALADQSVIKPYLRDRAWSPNIISAVKSFLGKDTDGTFYDVGANIGMTLIPIAKNPRIHCVGFEPDPGNFKLLQANVAVNGQLHTELNNVAVADKAGEMRFARNAYNSGDHHLCADGEQIVECIALDDREVPGGKFAIKIDTQGAEPLIFKGARRHLNAAGLIICEFWPWGMKRMGASPDEVMSFVESHGGYGRIVRHNEPIIDLHPVETLMTGLAGIVRDGSEYAAVDLVLSR